MPDSPFVRTIDENTPAVAANTTDTTDIGEVPFAGVVTGVTYTPEADITGADTNSRTFSLINRGTDGNSSTVVATLAMTNGVNAPNDDERAITLSGTPANLNVAEGDILEWNSTTVGTGIADPGGRVQVSLQRADA